MKRFFSIVFSQLITAQAYCDIPVCASCSRVRTVATTNEFVCGKNYIDIGFAPEKIPTNLKTLYSSANTLTRSGGCRSLVFLEFVVISETFEN